MTAATRRRSLAAFAVVLLASSAHAQDAPQQAPTPADTAFKAGRELYKQGKFAEACAEFEKSQRLDPQLGTQFNIAQCSEKIGKLATAVAALREVVARDTNETRKAAAREQLEALEPRVPKVVVNIQSPPPGLSVSLDSKAGSRAIDANKPIEVDFGDYTIVANARGYTEVISRLKVTEPGVTKTVDITLEPGANADIVRRRDGEGDAPGKRKTIGIAATAGGGAVLVGGIVFGVLARSQWNDAKAVCGGTTCNTPGDVDRANELADGARSKALFSTVLTIGGAVIAGAGLYLWLAAPGDTRLAPTASEDGAGVTLSGQF